MPISGAIPRPRALPAVPEAGTVFPLGDAQVTVVETDAAAQTLSSRWTTATPPPVHQRSGRCGGGGGQ
ncbi:MAG: hypothetical protein ACLRIS_08100 [Flavonifractor plautii]